MFLFLSWKVITQHKTRDTLLFSNDTHLLSVLPSHRCPLVGCQVASLPLWAGSAVLPVDHLCCWGNFKKETRESEWGSKRWRNCKDTARNVVQIRTVITSNGYRRKTLHKSEGTHSIQQWRTWLWSNNIITANTDTEVSLIFRIQTK